MKILALETTEKIGTVAALCDDEVLAELELSKQQRTTQSLAPSLKTLLKEVGWRPDQVDLVAVTVGPGSFTGLRTGVTTAKVFAYAAGAEVLGVDTLETIAAGAPADIQSISVAVDAQRGEVVAGSFRRGPDGWFYPTAKSELIDADVWLGGLPPDSVVAGPVLQKLSDQVPDHVTVLAPQFCSPKAFNVGQLAWRDYVAGRRDDIWSLAPRYSRRSAAEEKHDVSSKGRRAGDR